MRTRLRSKFTLLFMMFAIAMLAFPVIAFGQTAAPTIQSDKDDYAPGSTVTLTGSGWQPGESVHINVNDDVGQTWSRNVDVTADPSGNITDSFSLPDWFVATYSVTATGSSGTATTSFTDARLVTTATLNGASSVNVQAGDSINANVTVQTDGTGANARWRSTGWRIATTAPTATADVTCVNHANYDSEGTNSESFSINAPNTPGTYNAYFIAFSDDSCTWTTGPSTSGGNQSATFTLTNGVVATPTTRATTTTLARTAGTSPSTYGDSLTFTATVNASAGSPTAGQGTVTFKDGANTICSNVALNASSQATCTTSALNVAGSPHSITAEYSGVSSGSPQFQASTSNALSQTVNPKSLTGSFTAANKQYDGTTAATVLTRSLSGVVGSDVVTLNGGTATFDNKNVGTGKTVTLSGASLGGADAGNYVLASGAITDTADITARDLTVSATGVNKVYDGNTTATVNLSTNKVSGDDVTASYTSASFNDKNVGTGKPVSVSGISISGADASNYNLTNTTASATADITPKTVTGSFTAADKVYDGNDSATITSRSLSGAISGDDVSLSGSTATFNNELVGTSKTVTGTGFTLAGADKDNYSLASSTLTTTASILAWTTKGFYQPVDMGDVLNTVKNGSTVPVKFELFSGTTELTSTSAVSSISAKTVNCTAFTGDPEDAIETVATGGTILRYDATGGQFIYNWQTPKKPNTCYNLTMTAADGSTITAYFKLK